MPNYMSAWKTFRRLGNEPEATAEHVLSLPRWPGNKNLRILDVGCGDGRMVEAFLLKARQSIGKVTILDPDRLLLDEAAHEIRSLGLDVDVLEVAGVADRQALELAADHDVALAIHLVYLLAHNRFRALVDHWPPGVPLYVVLDAPDSVFTELWSETAPDYALRSRRVHEYLSGEANGRLDVRRTDFTTRVANPFGLPEPVRDLVLSLLCYCDFAEFSDTRRAKVESVISSHVERGQVTCSCTCYEIQRKSS
jgi:SAM-dependent methyltransferase